jgi:acetaldehyde dehydrogenase
MSAFRTAEGRSARGSSSRVPCAVLGTGNIGTDLMYKLLRSEVLELRAFVGIDPDSEGLARARHLGIDASHEGVRWLLSRSSELAVVFEATSARIHARHAPLLLEAGLRAIDLTPAGVGPPVVPPVNLSEHAGEANLNLITCGGQATVPIVAAVTRVTPVPYAEIVSTVASRSAGPGTRQNIDEFTRRTAQGLVDIGGARLGKAIIVLNPAEPPIIMRNTVYCALTDDTDREAVAASIERMVAEVATYVPGYRLKSSPVLEKGPFRTPGGEVPGRVTTLLEVQGAGDFLPPYAGNLDIMTAAAVRVGELIASDILAGAEA